MKHKFMSQDTLLIIFNVWMAAGVVSFMGSYPGFVFCFIMMLVTLGQLLWASKEDIKRFTPTPPQPEKEDVK